MRAESSVRGTVEHLLGLAPLLTHVILGPVHGHG
jgi:hypothetical protein